MSDDISMTITLSENVPNATRYIIRQLYGYHVEIRKMDGTKLEGMVYKVEQADLVNPSERDTVALSPEHSTETIHIPIKDIQCLHVP